MFLLNSRIPLVRFSSELIVYCLGKGEPSHTVRSCLLRAQPLPAILQNSSNFVHGPLDPILRANPFPEVTDLFCRLPLSTLFYGPEAANLGDLMRLWVRSGAI